MGLFATLGMNDILHNAIIAYADCRDYFKAMLSIVMLSVVASIISLPCHGWLNKDIRALSQDSLTEGKCSVQMTLYQLV